MSGQFPEARILTRQSEHHHHDLSNSSRLSESMRATARLCEQVLRLTLFTRPNCGLCDEAKYVLAKVKPKRPFEYHEIDVMSSGQRRWRDLYEFDTPVVCSCHALNGLSQSWARALSLTSFQVHIDKDGQEQTASSKKLMHHITEVDVHKAMDEVEKGSN